MDEKTTMKYRATSNFYYNGLLIEQGYEININSDEDASSLLMMNRIVKVSEPVVERVVQKPVVTTRKKK